METEQAIKMGRRIRKSGWLTSLLGVGLLLLVKRLNQISTLVAITMALAFTAPAHAAPATASQSGSGFLTVNGGSGGNKHDDIELVGLGSGVIDVIDNGSGGSSLGSFSGVTGVAVNLKGGENSLSLDNVDIPNSLTISAGGKDDTVSVNNALVVGGFLTIALGKGDNHVNADHSGVDSISVGSNVNIDTGSGDDAIGLSVLNSNAHVTIKAGGGDDDVAISGSSSIGNRLIINAGSGNNTVVIADTWATVAQVFSGGGEDNVQIVNTQIADFMDVISGGGVDTVLTDSSTAGNEYRINCGPGVDTLTDGGTPTVVVDCETQEPSAQEPSAIAIGDIGPGGGIVFSVSADGMSGLEAAPEDQTSAIWCNSNTDIPEVENFDFSNTDPNSGAENTPRIIDVCGGSSAAGMAAAYEWPNGQTDGFLPNREELELLYNQRNDVGDFAPGGYWSSSEVDLFNYAWSQDFVDGDLIEVNKNVTFRVRAVRAF